MITVCSYMLPVYIYLLLFYYTFIYILMLINNPQYHIVTVVISTLDHDCLAALFYFITHILVPLLIILAFKNIYFYTTEQSCK